MLRRKIGKRIKFIRTCKGISQLKLAEDSGISERFIRYIECGEKNFSLEVLYRILQGLNISFCHLFRKIEGDENDE